MTRLVDGEKMAVDARRAVEMGEAFLPILAGPAKDLQVGYLAALTDIAESIEEGAYDVEAE